MVEKKEKPEHEKIINDINSKNKKISSYVWGLKHDYDIVLTGIRDDFINNMGTDKAYEYLKTSEGQKHYSDKGYEAFKQLMINKCGVDKNINEFDLTRLVEGKYGMTKNILSSIASRGPDFDFGDLKTEFLNKYLENVKSSTIQNHLLDFDTKQIPSIAKHIGLDTYLTDVNSLKDDKFKGSIAQAVINSDGGKNPLNVSYIKQDPNLSSFLKDNYKFN